MEALKCPAVKKKTRISNNRMIRGYNLFDRAAKGLLKAPPSDVITRRPSATPSGKTESIAMATAAHSPKDLSVQPLDLSKITPALKNVKQVSPPARIKIDLTGPGELPLDLSTKKRILQDGQEDSGVSVANKARDSGSLHGSSGGLIRSNSRGDVCANQCVSCQASRLKSCAHLSKEGPPQPAHVHQNSTGHLNTHLTDANSERHMNSGGGNGNASMLTSGNINSGDARARVDALAKSYVSTDSISSKRSGRYSPIELPKQRMTQTLKGQGIVNHRGRAFIVSPVRPQIKGQPVDVSSCGTISVKQENNNRTQTTNTPNVPSVSTTLDNVMSCKPDFEHKNAEMAFTQNGSEDITSTGVANVVSTVQNTMCKDGTAKGPGPLLNIPKYTPSVQKLKVKKDKKSGDLKGDKSDKPKKLKKVKRQNSVTDSSVLSQTAGKCENVSPESNVSITSSTSSAESTFSVRLPRHIMVARKSTRPHKPTRKVLEMVETSDMLESPSKHSPPKSGANDAFNSNRGSVCGRTRDAVSPNLPTGKIRTVPKKFTRYAVVQKGGRLGEKKTSSTSTSPSKENKDVVVKRNAKKNLPVFMPTTTETEALISPLKLDVLTTTSHSTFNPPVTCVEGKQKVTDITNMSAHMQNSDSSSEDTGTRFSLEPENYCYPSDTEPHHILSCPDWREDLIKYKRERLHLPPKIISVPKHTQPNFKAPTYVEIPKSNRLFAGGGKKSKKSPPNAKSKSSIKLTITGPSITMHEYPKGTSPQKLSEQAVSPVQVQKPVLNIPSSQESASVPKSPVRPGAPKSPVGSMSKFSKMLQHKKELKKKSLKLNIKNMSPLMKKVRKEYKQERHRIASCSGRSTGTPASKSPVRSESPGGYGDVDCKVSSFSMNQILSVPSPIIYFLVAD